VAHWRFDVGYVAEHITLTGWTTPPTITDGNVSSVANEANVWRDDLTWLYNRIALPNASMHAIQARTFGSADAPIFYGYMQYLGTMLYGKWAGGVVGKKFSGNPSLRIKVNGTQIRTFALAATDYQEEEWSYDLSGLGLTHGNLYKIEVWIDGSSSIRDYWGALLWLYQDSLIIPAGTTTWKNPATWAAGEYATGSSGAKRFQYVSDDLTYLYDRLNTNNLRRYNFASRDNTTFLANSAWPNNEASRGHHLIHRLRWLWYTDDAMDIVWYEKGSTTTPATRKQALEDLNAGEHAAFDLDSLGWMKPGMLYKVEGEGHWALEDLNA
jgi:hypothetical protein